MTRWEATYLGTRIAVVAASPEAYAVLSEHGLTSWQAGGCAILTEALVQLLGAERYGLVREYSGVVDHIVAKVDGYYLDADGAYTSHEMCEKHETLEGHRVTMKRLSGAVAIEGVFCSSEAVVELVELLEAQGVGRG